MALLSRANLKFRIFTMLNTVHDSEFHIHKTVWSSGEYQYYVGLFASLFLVIIMGVGGCGKIEKRGR